MDPLGPRVRALFTDLAHAGDLGIADQPGVLLCGEAGDLAGGTQVRIALRLRQAQVCEARYRVYGCPYTLATCEWLARRLEGAELPEASAPALMAAVGGPVSWALALEIPPERLGRLLVIEDALQALMLRRSMNTSTDPVPP